MSGRWLASDDPRWSVALERIPHDVYHLPTYTRLEAGAQSARAMAFLYEEADQAALIPMLERTTSGSSQRDVTSAYGYPGPIATPGAAAAFRDRAIEALLESLRDMGAVSCFVRFHPLFRGFEDSCDTRGSLVHHGSTVAIDLNQTEGELWEGIRKNHQRQIRRTRESGVRVVVDEWGKLTEFADLYRETMRRVDADTSYFFTDEYFEGLVDALPGGVHLLHAEFRGRMIGGMLVLTSADLAEYHLGGTRSDALILQPAKLLMFEATMWAKAQGLQTLHLGGGLGGADDALFHYKAGFSSWHLPFYTWRCVVHAKAYEELSLARGIEAGPPHSGFFPAYRLPVDGLTASSRAATAEDS